MPLRLPALARTRLMDAGVVVRRSKKSETAMAHANIHGDEETEKLEVATAFTRADLACTFGPSFFLGHLARFVRDHCPDREENLPLVQLRLADGETLDVCHIIGVSPRWVMLAVSDPPSHHDGMAIELVPYELIRRVCISTRRGEGASIGYAQMRSPEIVAAETLLRAATAVHHESV